MKPGLIGNDTLNALIRIKGNGQRRSAAEWEKELAHVVAAIEQINDALLAASAERGVEKKAQESKIKDAEYEEIPRKKRARDFDDDIPF